MAARRRFAKKGPDSVAGGIKRQGYLTSLVGGPPKEHMDEVRRLAASGTPQQKKAANYYLDVLNPKG